MHLRSLPICLQTTHTAMCALLQLVSATLLQVLQLPMQWPVACLPATTISCQRLLWITFCYIAAGAAVAYVACLANAPALLAVLAALMALTGLAWGECCCCCCCSCCRLRVQ
jgi:hypothetical protein